MTGPFGPIDNDGPSALKFGRSGRCVAFLLLAASAVVFVVGWIANVEALARPFPDAAAMAPLTALSFALLSIAFLRPRALRWLCLSVLGIAAANLMLIAGGVPSGLETIIPMTEAPGDRMSPLTSAGLVVAASALYALARDRRLLAAGLGFFGLSGFAMLMMIAMLHLVGPGMQQMITSPSLYSEVAFILIFTAVLIEA